MITYTIPQPHNPDAPGTKAQRATMIAERAAAVAAADLGATSVRVCPICEDSACETKSLECGK